jgi:hypothetical protein
MLAVHPAMAIPVTFAQYFQNNGALQEWTISQSGNTTTIFSTGSVSVLFSGVPGLPFSGPENAIFTFSATSTQLGNCGVACANNDTFTQQGYSGTFSFIDNGGGIAQGTDLLSGVFNTGAIPSSSGASLGSTIGQTGASIRGSSDPSTPNQLILYSAYLDFAGQVQETASFSLSSLIPNFAVGTVVNDQADPSGSFNASGSGTFSANPGPALSPEPASTLLIGGGLCVLAFGLRKRKFKIAQPMM